MEGQLRGFVQEPGDFTLDAVRSIRGIEALGLDPIMMGYHPIARMNPYHDLIYQQTRLEGIGASRVIKEETLPELAELARRGFPTALHLHWLNQVLRRATSVKEAQRDRAAFFGKLDRHLDAGGRLVWTIHNILPHGARFEEEEARLSQEVIDRCDAVHLMAASTPEIVAPYFTIPSDRAFTVPHPSYLGAYPDVVSREQARHELGLWPDELVFLVLGAIRAYKGLDDLLDAWEIVGARHDRPRRLVIAGRPGEDAGIATVLERAALSPSIVVYPGEVETNDIQRYMRAADVAVLPYVRALNSGSLLLAITFGLPAIVPMGGGLAEAVDPRFSLGFTAGDPDSLAAVLLEADSLRSDAARAAALETALRLAPGPLSRRLGMEIHARLSSTRRVGPP
jgi:glycosyltransferase involved in cell wall biosynthesis